MSAFVVDREHIMYLIKAAEHYGRSCGGIGWYHNGEYQKLSPGDMTEEIRTANMLWQENIKSVLYRYPQDNFDTMPGPIGEFFVIDEKDLNMLWLAFDPVQVLCSCRCYEYQSCEHQSWKESEAHEFIISLISYAISALPGYDAAIWGAPKPYRR